MFVVNPMHRTMCYLLLGLSIGCTRAPGPIIHIDPAAITEIRNINLSEVVNYTQHQEITPIVEQTITAQLSQLEKYSLTSPEEADATIKCIITQYIPLQEELVKSETEASYDVYDFENTKEEVKKGHGMVWGCLMDLLIPSRRVKGKEKYKYKTVIRSPLIEIKLNLNKNDKTIYEGCKFISSENRIPECYSATYEGALPSEQRNSIEFIIRLAIKELLYPLR